VASGRHLHHPGDNNPRHLEDNMQEESVGFLMQNAPADGRIRLIALGCRRWKPYRLPDRARVRGNAGGSIPNITF
jgi:hypothetical protein